MGWKILLLFNNSDLRAKFFIYDVKSGGNDVHKTTTFSKKYFSNEQQQSSTWSGRGHLFRKSIGNQANLNYYYYYFNQIGYSRVILVSQSFGLPRESLLNHCLKDIKTSGSKGH